MLRHGAGAPAQHEGQLEVHVSSSWAAAEPRVEGCPNRFLEFVPLGRTPPARSVSRILFCGEHGSV